MGNEEETSNAGEYNEEPPKMEEIITPDMLQAIASGYNPDCKVVSHHAEFGTKIGDNYMSIMFAIDIQLEHPDTKENETLTTMVKTIPRVGFRAEMINELHAFAKEAEVYTKIFSDFTLFQVQKGIPSRLRFQSWPKCYASHVDKSSDFLAMENLKVQGYKMGNRQIGLDYSHSAFVLQNLARYHAISYAKFGGSRKAILDAFPVIHGWMFSKDEKVGGRQSQFFNQSLVSLKGHLENAGEKLAASRLEKLEKGNVLKVLEKMIESDDQIAVITHGDCWINNMLFRYDSFDKSCRVPIQLKFVDFQISSATSRIVDLYYFLLTSVNLDVLKKYEEALQMTYYVKFIRFSHMLGVDTDAKGLTWTAFIKEISHYRFYGVCLGLFLCPMLAANSSDIPVVDGVVKEGSNTAETDAAMGKFMTDIMGGGAIQKAKYIVLEQLPKCNGVSQYL